MPGRPGCVRMSLWKCVIISEGVKIKSVWWPDSEFLELKPWRWVEGFGQRRANFNPSGYFPLEYPWRLPHNVLGSRC